MLIAVKRKYNTIVYILYITYYILLIIYYLLFIFILFIFILILKYPNFYLLLCYIHHNPRILIP